MTASEDMGTRVSPTVDTGVWEGTPVQNRAQPAEQPATL